ncbi:hypothetical protein IAT38_003994 [Cryptococcus sp. DSM 104549]
MPNATGTTTPATPPPFANPHRSAPTSPGTHLQLATPLLSASSGIHWSERLSYSTDFASIMAADEFMEEERKEAAAAAAAKEDETTRWAFVWTCALPRGQEDDNAGRREKEELITRAAYQQLLVLKRAIVKKMTLVQAARFDEKVALVIAPTRRGHKHPQYAHYPRDAKGYFLRGRTFGQAKIEGGVSVEVPVLVKGGG